VIAAYNAERFVARAIRSALSQASVLVEVIIVDDGSTDRTLEAVRDAADGDPRVRVERLAGNKGAAAARNLGFGVARGRWIAVLDSDDLITPDRMARLIQAANRVGADIVSDNPVLVAEDNPDGAAAYLPDARMRWIGAPEYMVEGRLFHRGRDYGYLKPVFRAEALKAKGLSYDERLRIGEDDDLMLRALLAGLRYWLEPLQAYFYLQHSASTSHRLSIADATAMCTASFELTQDHLQSPHSPLLRKRHRAMERGLALLQLIDALKRNRWNVVARIAARDPAVLPLLRIPLGAAARKFSRTLGARFSRRKQAASIRRVEPGLDP
jgi:succinoglycan biosynthesis protein ExoO